MKPVKAMTIRLSSDQASELEWVANVDNQAVSEIIRTAITEHIENRKKDPSFQNGLVARINMAQRLLGKPDGLNQQRRR